MGQFPEHGLKNQEVLSRIKNRVKDDYEFDSGKILGSMCTATHDIAKEVAKKYIDRNLGDPGLHPGAKEIENDLINMLNDLMNNEDGSGVVTSGGSEANLLALRTMRDLSDVSDPEVIIPKSAHVSLLKSADILGIKAVKADLDDSYRVDVDDVRSKINENTVGLVGIVGTTILGAIDPIRSLSDIALNNDLFLHVDSALGGLVVPFMDREVVFDFRLPGVTSLTVDPHKMGMAPIPTGTVLFRDEGFVESISMEVPYLAGGKTDQPNVTGTRPGFSALGAWAIFKHLGRDGFKRIVDRSLENTKWLASQVESSVVTWPEINVLGIEADKPEGWKVSEYNDFIRVVVMPHVRKEHLESFVKDLRDQEALR